MGVRMAVVSPVASSMACVSGPGLPLRVLSSFL